jgi:hypothetical protein
MHSVLLKSQYVLRQAQDEEIRDCMSADGTNNFLMLSLSKHAPR